jgi:hypothetical protein
MNKKLIFIIALVLTPLVLLPLFSFFTQTAYSKDSTKQNNNSKKHSEPTIVAIKDKPFKPVYSVEGFDWSLPKNTVTNTNSGLIDEYDRGLDFTQSVFAIIRWDEANPKKGRYDFSKFESYLSDVSPKRALVRLEVNSACETPRWALKSLRSSPDKSLIFWDKSYIDLIKPFINAFAKRYASDPRVIGVQLGIADGAYNNDSCEADNKDGWGEFWMSPKSIKLAQNKYGFSADIFEKQSKAIIDVYVNAFGKDKGKLAFTNIGPSFSWDDIAKPYNQKLKKIAKYVWQAGLGNRDGHIEIWMRFIDQTYGVQLASMPDGTCFLSFDESYANRIRGRYWGTENEFYGDKDYVIEANGPYKNQAYRFMVSSLRALQMRRNYFSVAGDSMATIKDPVYKTQDFLHYLTKVMGKQIENTPDAFILLGERYISQDHASNFANQPCVKQSSDKVAVRSFGRWLTEKSSSKPALKISMPASENHWGQDFYMPQGVDYEYSARMAKKFELDINDRLIQTHCKDQNKCKVEMKITYKDTAKTQLNLQYGDSLGENEIQSHLSSGDNKIKTLSFTVNSRFQNKLMGSDFIITSKNPLPLIMIRVNFL